MLEQARIGACAWLATTACGGFGTPIQQDDTGVDTADTTAGGGNGGGDNGGNAGGGNGGNGGGGNGGNNGDSPPIGTAEDFFLTEVFDGGTVRYVEIFNPDDVGVRLDGYVINAIWKDDPSSLSTILLPDELVSPGGTFVVCFSGGATEFEGLFGRTCDFVTDELCVEDGADPCGAGDEVYLLKRGSTILDWFGSIGSGGYDVPVDYTDKVAVRNSDIVAPPEATGGSRPWLGAQWTITAGTDAASPGTR